MLVDVNRLSAAVLALLLTACGEQPLSLQDDTDQPLVEVPDGGIQSHGYWAFRHWPTLVLSVAGTCPVEAVDKALGPFRAAGISIGAEVGVCRPDHWHIEDGRVCLRTDDTALMERGSSGSSYWEARYGTADQIVVGGISVMSDCNPMVIAHELGHILGLGHSSDPGNTMFGTETDVLDFKGALEVAAARRQAHLAATGPADKTRQP